MPPEVVAAEEHPSDRREPDDVRQRQRVGGRREVLGARPSVVARPHARREGVVRLLTGRDAIQLIFQSVEGRADRVISLDDGVARAAAVLVIRRPERNLLPMVLPTSLDARPAVLVEGQPVVRDPS